MQQKKWYVIDSESNGRHSHHDPIKFLTKSIESYLSDYFDAYIPVTRNNAVEGGNDNKAPLPFRKCKTEMNDTFFDEAEFINTTMPMYTLIEYNDNCSDTSECLWQFKRDETERHVDLTVDN